MGSGCLLPPVIGFIFTNMADPKKKQGFAHKNILLCRRDGRQGLLRKSEKVWQKLEWSRDPKLMEFYTNAMTQTEPLREPFLTPSGSDDLDKFVLSCAAKERNRAISQLKEDIGIEYLPVNLLPPLLNDQAADVGLDWEKNGARIRAIFFFRFQNLYQKNQPTYLTVTRSGMKRFMQTGRMSDHVACFRPFTPEERKWLIDFVCGQAGKRRSFSIRFLKAARQLPMTLVGIEEEGLAVFHRIPGIVSPNITGKCSLRIKPFWNITTAFTATFSVRNGRKARRTP